MATVLSATPGLLKIANLAATETFLAQIAAALPAQRQAQLLTQLKLLVDAGVPGGERLKILEALAAGTPVITTTIGVEGLRLRHGEHCTAADGAELFSAAIVDAIRLPKSAEVQAAVGRARVLAEYDWSGLATKMDDVWQEATAKPPSKGATR